MSNPQLRVKKLHEATVPEKHCTHQTTEQLKSSTANTQVLLCNAMKVVPHVVQSVLSDVFRRVSERKSLASFRTTGTERGMVVRKGAIDHRECWEQGVHRAEFSAVLEVPVG